MGQKENMRLLALETLLMMQKDGVPSHLIIHDVLESHAYLSRQEKAFFQRLCEGTLEYRLQLDYLLDQVSSIRTEKMKPVIREILRLAVYQIRYMDAVPDSAAVNEAVRLAEKKGFRGLRGFVNGVLHAVLRSIAEIRWPDRERDPAAYFAAVYSMPSYLAEKWYKLYGAEKTEEICRFFLQEQPVTVRVRKEGEALRDFFRENREFCLLMEETQAASWNGKGGITSLPVFTEGSVTVQDLSSQLCVLAAGIRRGDLVVDLCAAPGGKTIFAADLTGPEGQVIAGDVSERKLEQIRENVQRCGISHVQIRLADATEEMLFMKEKADVVLADVPCSGYGVIGKKQDIKYHASAEKETSLLTLQRQILRQAVSLVKPGGTLLFSTCTFGSRENQENREWLEGLPELEPCNMDDCIPDAVKNADTAKGWREILPGEFGSDGFFFARFRKKRNEH